MKKITFGDYERCSFVVVAAGERYGTRIQQLGRINEVVEPLLLLVKRTLVSLLNEFQDQNICNQTRPSSVVRKSLLSNDPGGKEKGNILLLLLLFEFYSENA